MERSEPRRHWRDAVSFFPRQRPPIAERRGCALWWDRENVESDLSADQEARDGMTDRRMQRNQSICTAVLRATVAIIQID